jgi:hypothetical protein
MAKTANSPYKDDVDRVSRLSGLGDLTTTATNNLLGFDHRGTGSALPANRDSYGLTFFTRPLLNLSYDNIAKVRKLTPLLTDNKQTYQRAIRAYLDPKGAIGEYGLEMTDSPLVDNLNPFIPLLSNNILSMSGWPDLAMDTYTSKPGIYREAWSMADGTTKLHETFDIQVSFRNIEGDPITLLFNTWLHYMANVYDGTILPYPEFIKDNRIDYQTRIYRLVLDPTRRFVQKIAACGAAFPIASSIGAAFNFSSDKVFNGDSDQISVPFKCIGADYNDPVLIEEFNATVSLNHTEMQFPSQARYVRLEPYQLNYFNREGYPRINPETFELEWWVPPERYAAWQEEYNTYLGK